MEIKNKKSLNWKKLTRHKRGELISKKFEIKKENDKWKVPSQSGNGFYLVSFSINKPICNCMDYRIRHRNCKHIIAVETFIKMEIDKEGKITKTKKVKVTYSQNWKAYDKSQTNEKLFFLKLLKDLCNFIESPVYNFGRPKLPLSEMAFCSILKVYSTFSLRRYMSDVKIAKEMGMVDNVPCFSSIGHFLQKDELTPILYDLIQISSTPLKTIETNFAVDSSGFSTVRFARYYSFKHQKDLKYRQWIKAHVCSGVKTNIITAVKITEGSANDSPQLAKLVKETARQFKMGEVSCDRAYISRQNLQLIEDVGAVPYIPFKVNSVAKPHASLIWKNMYYYFMYKHEEFMQHYHKRSNAETVFHMIKTKFKDSLRSKSKTAQINELLCKIICHNLTVVIQEINELGIKGEFLTQQTI
jgi:transposase